MAAAERLLGGGVFGMGLEGACEMRALNGDRGLPRSSRCRGPQEFGCMGGGDMRELEGGASLAA